MTEAEDVARFGFRLWLLVYAALVAVRIAGVVATPWLIVLAPVLLPASIIAGFFLLSLLWVVVMIAIWWMP